jgi:uncharacterized protein
MRCLLLFVFQRKLIYFPVDDYGIAPHQVMVLSLEDVTLRGWALHPEASKAVLYFGGNAEAIEFNMDHFLQLFPDRAIFLMPYRGYGASDGAPNESALYADALAVFDRVAAEHTQVSVIGRSLGSGVATYVAAHRKVEKLVLVTPFDSIVALAQQQLPFLPVTYLLLDRYESIARVAQISAPTLMLVAEKDQVVPRGNSDRLAAAFDPEQLQVVTVKGANHNTISNIPAFSTSLRAFL